MIFDARLLHVVSRIVTTVNFSDFVSVHL